MNNTVILGGKSKFGLALAKQMELVGHDVLAVGRPEMDFKSGWMKPLGEMIEQRFGGPDGVQTLVINVYDYDQDAEMVQNDVFVALWQVFKTRPVSIVVMGSLAHYKNTDTSTYASAKKIMATRLMSLMNDPERRARIIILEPGYMENARHRAPGSRYATFEEVGNTLLDCLDLKMHFVRLAIQGQHVTLAPVKDEQ